MPSYCLGVARFSILKALAIDGDKGDGDGDCNCVGDGDGDEASGRRRGQG